MAIFDEKTRQQLKTVLDQMKNEVTIVFFSQEIECQTCRDGKRFVNEIASISDKILVEHYSLVTDKDKSDLYGIDKVPAIVLLDKDKNNTRMRFYGIPGGYEINSFLGSILAASGKEEAIPKPIKARIDKIGKPVHIQVFVSLGCPHCPNAVMAGHLLALENENVTADMVETSTFNHLAIRYNVSGVPKVVINDKYEFIGAQPITAYLDAIEKL